MKMIYLSISDSDRNGHLIIDGSFYLLGELFTTFAHKEIPRHIISHHPGELEGKDFDGIDKQIGAEIDPG